MDDYLEVLKNKAKKIDLNIEHCGYDKECIADAISSKVKTDLQNEELSLIKKKAAQINADFSKCNSDKECILTSIQLKVKEVLEDENELFASMDLNQNFKPLYFDQDTDILDLG